MRFKISILSLGLFLLSISLSIAKEKADGEDWQCNLAPFYLWAINIDGDLRVGTDKLPGNIAPTIPIMSHSTMSLII